MKIKINDYCFVSKWSDGSPHDPWAVGFLTEININKHETLYRVDCTDQYFKHARRISSEEGNRIVIEYHSIEKEQ